MSAGVEFSAVVVDIREESRVAGRQRWQMALDRTEFGAGDVGTMEAVARSGVRLVVPVLGVVVDDGGRGVACGGKAAGGRYCGDGAGGRSLRLERRGAC